METSIFCTWDLASLRGSRAEMERANCHLGAYRPRQGNVVRLTTGASAADVLSRLPLPATAEDLQPRNRLTDPSNLDVYFVGASGIHLLRLRTSSDSSLGRLTTPIDDIFACGRYCFPPQEQHRLGLPPVHPKRLPAHPRHWPVYPNLSPTMFEDWRGEFRWHLRSKR